MLGLDGLEAARRACHNLQRGLNGTLGFAERVGPHNRRYRVLTVLHVRFKLSMTVYW